MVNTEIVNTEITESTARAWFPPTTDDFEITPEAAMYSGRR
jgi:hypothetical protein